MPHSAGIILENRDAQSRESGTLVVTEHRMIFRNDTREVEVSIHGCTITLGGAANLHAYVTHPSRPDVTLDITDFSFFRQAAFRDHPQAQQFKKDQGRHKTLRRLSLAFVAFLVLAPLYLVFFERDWLVDRVVARIPEEADMVVGDLFIKVYEDSIIDDKALAADVARLTGPLIAAARTPPFAYNIHIIDSDEMNAYAVPGGHILIHSALIEKTESAEELLGVLAHEAAHINGRHSMKHILHGLGTWAFLFLLGGDPNHIVAMVGDHAQTLSARGYSRQHEHEADAAGYDYMVRAGLNPDGINRFFMRLKDEEDKNILRKGMNSPLTNLFSTHPLTDDRIAALDALMAQNKLAIRNNGLQDFDYAAFKARVAELAANGSAPSPSTQDTPPDSPADSSTEKETR